MSLTAELAPSTPPTSAHTDSGAPPATTAYPAPPWVLRGWGYQTFQGIDVAAVRPLVPPSLRIVPIWPGKTFGTVYVASYEQGSVLQYHELIVAPALVWAKGRLGLWVSHIYVDDPSSMAGGREVWGLPKELASFAVDEHASAGRITVSQGERTLCTLSHDRVSRGLCAPALIPTFGQRQGAPLFFVGRVQARISPTRVRVEVPAESPFATLGVHRPRLGMAYANLAIVASAPGSHAGRRRDRRPMARLSRLLTSARKRFDSASIGVR
jgi:acetoacetate decarboxylase